MGMNDASFTDHCSVQDGGGDERVMLDALLVEVGYEMRCVIILPIEYQPSTSLVTRLKLIERSCLRCLS